MAKLCANCGRQLNETAKFCASCGARQQDTDLQPTQPQPHYQQIYIRAPKLKSKVPLIAGGIAGAFVIVFIAVFVVTKGFGLFENGGDDSNVNNASASRSSAGNAASSKDTQDPIDNETNITTNDEDFASGETPQTSGGDDIFVHALTGAWGQIGYNALRLPIWVFGADGRFAYYSAIALRPDDGTSYQPSHYEIWTQGKYRINGYIIELYDCMESSYFEYTNANSDSWRYGFNAGGAPENISADELLNGVLPDPLKTNDFTAQFEFLSDERLRLIFDFKTDSFDSDFGYMSESRIIDVPTYTLPGLAWPKDSLAPELPEYSDGRIREIVYDEYSIKIVFDKITPAMPEAVWAFTQLLITDGWEWRGYSHDNADDIDGWLAQGYYVTVDNYEIGGKYELGFWMDINDCLILSISEWRW